MAELAEERYSANKLIEEIRSRVAADEVLSYRPLDCFYVEEDPIYSRLAFFLSSILLTIYDRTPDVLRENSVKVTGLEPVKFDLGNPLHIGIVSYYYRALTTLCSTCPYRGECPWLNALLSLRKLFKTQ